MNTTFKMTLLGAALTIVSATSFAADTLTDLATTKSETVTVRMTVPKMVNITKPDDIVMAFNGKDAVTESVNFCIASNMGPNAAVKLTLTDDNAATETADFKLVNTNSENIDHNLVPFTVTYITTGQEKPIKYGVTHPNIKGAQWLQDCTSNKSSIRVDVAKEDALNVYFGEYTATLKMTVAAE